MKNAHQEAALQSAAIALAKARNAKSDEERSKQIVEAVEYLVNANRRDFTVMDQLRSLLN